MLDPAGGGVDPPAFEGRQTGAEQLPGPGVEGAVVAADVEHHGRPVVEGVHDVEDVAGVEADPPRRGPVPPVEDPDAGPGLRAASGTGSAGRPPRGRRRRRPAGRRRTTRVAVTPKSCCMVARGMVDLGAVDERSGGVELVVAQERRPEDVVAEEGHPARCRGRRAGGRSSARSATPSKSSTQTVSSSGRQPVGEAALDQGQQAAAVPDHVGVGRPVDRLRRTGRARGADLGRELAGPDPPVAVGDGVAVAQLDGVRPSRRRRTSGSAAGSVDRDRVGAVADEQALEDRRDGPVDGQRPLDRQLLGAPGRSCRPGTGWRPGRRVTLRRPSPAPTGCAAPAPTGWPYGRLVRWPSFSDDLRFRGLRPPGHRRAAPRPARRRPADRLHRLRPDRAQPARRQPAAALHAAPAPAGRSPADRPGRRRRPG